MKVLCYGVLLKILVLCRASGVKQKGMNGALLLSVNSEEDVSTDDTLASVLIRCQSNLSEKFTGEDVLKKITIEHLTDYLERNILTLVNPNKEDLMVRALSDIIASSDFPARRVGKLGRRQILKVKDTATFLANVFLYTLAVPNRDPDGEAFANTIDEAYLEKFANVQTADDAASKDDEPIVPEQLVLFTQTGGRCLNCAELLFHENDVGEYYAAHDTVEILDDESHEIMRFYLCPNCASKFPHFSDDKKRELVASFKRIKLAAELPIHLSVNERSNEQIALIVKTVHDKGVISDNLRKSDTKDDEDKPKAIEDKIKNQFILRTISENATHRYFEVNEALNNLATANRLNVDKIGKVMGRLYEDIADAVGYERKSPVDSNIVLQERVYGDIVNELDLRSHHESRAVCEWVVAYFIQMCVIFDAISK